MFHGCRFTWNFLLAAVSFPMVGVDFLRHFQLMVDPAANMLVDKASLQSFATVSSVTGQREAGQAASPAALPAAPPSPPAAVAALSTVTCPQSPVSEQANFPTVVNSSKTLPRRPSGDMEHHIVTKRLLLSCRFRRLDGEKLAAAKKEFLQMERDGIIRRSDNPWSSPLHMVQKPDGSWRPCGDYWRLNLVTVPDSYPLPKISRKRR
jgi:hypothetical protein